MDKFQFLNDWYNREEERKVAVENSLNIPIGILTLLFLVQFYLIKEFDYSNCKDWEVICLLMLVIVSCFSSLFSGFFILKSYHNFPDEYKYYAIPYPSQLLSYEDELINFYKQNAASFNNIGGEEKFQEYLQKKLAELIDRNSFINDEKYRFLNIAKRLLILSIFTIVIAFVPFLTNTFSKPTESHQIEMVNLEQLNKRIENIENRLNRNPKKYGIRRKTATTDTTSSTSGQTN